MENINYRDIIIETYLSTGERSNSRIRAKPIDGQGLSTTLNVECSSKMREQYPIGTKIKVRAKITDREGTHFIYTNYNWAHERMGDNQVQAFISKENNNLK